MTKNLKLSFVLLTIFSAIIMAWRTLTNFFGGVGLNYVALLGIVVALLLLMMNDEVVKNRIKDMFIIACGFAIVEFIIYFVFEFHVGSAGVNRAFWIIQNIFTFFGILFFAYIMFRLFAELKGLKVGFIEAMLGSNKTNTNKPKKAKELENGSLEEKPSIRESLLVSEETEEPTVEFETVENEEN